MSKAEKTREYIIEKAAPIFNKKGYSGTSLNDLIKATGLTKGSIYGNFQNKDEVASAVFDYSIRNLNRRVSEFLKDKKNAEEKLAAFTEYYRINWKAVFEKGGCPVQNASIEADDNLSFLKKNVQDGIKGWIRGIGRIIEEGQTNEHFKKVNAAEYAYLFITILEGGIMLAKIMDNHKLLFNALDRIDLIVKDELLKTSKK